MPKKLKLLISAYACCPDRGSEPGMGWNFVSGLSEFHEVHVITETLKWKTQIEKHLLLFPELKNNLTFYFIKKKRNKKLRKLWPPSYYWFYKQWQQKAYHLAAALDEKENFDMVHQLNMVGYREPGYLWKIDKPFVWGPIGGLENTPWNFLPSLGFQGMLFYTGRNLLNSWQRTFKTRPKKAAHRKNSILISATPNTAKIIKDLWKRDSDVVCEVGQEKVGKFVPSKRNPNSPLRIVWSGIHTPRKNLPLLLNSLKDISIEYELHILGTGEMTKKWQIKAVNLGINEHCIWYGWLKREKGIEIMKTGHLFCITSINDLTSTVTLESLSYGIPIVCLDHCGFSDVVNEKSGIKIPVTTPNQAAQEFKKALEKLFDDEELRQELSAGAIIRAKDFSWENKVEKLNSIYNSLLN